MNLEDASESPVSFQLINRTSRSGSPILWTRRADDQLDHARTLRFAKNELIWIAGNMFYARATFRAGVHGVAPTFQLPEFE